ncbi:MAG TPA: alpha/beta hydrolase [Ktedonosporobacter sp.]|nr:alpha/beta hydrolase [Ktedonosporobacter sp.]
MVDINEMMKKRVVYAVPGMEQVRVRKDLTYKTIDETELKMDVYYPADLAEGERRPAVLFVHGLGPAEVIRHIKDHGQYVSWGELIAASGLIAVTFNHRSPDAHISFKDVASDVENLIGYVREHAEQLQIDNERLAIWAGSAGVPLGVRAALLDAPAFVKCLVAYYGPLHLRELQADWHLTEDDVHDLSATTYLKLYAAKLAPMLIIKAGLDYPVLNASIDAFMKEAISHNITLDFMTHPGGRHAFDILDDVPRSHEIIRHTLEFLKTHL